MEFLKNIRRKKTNYSQVNTNFNRILTRKDLTLLGIAAIIGGGIFSSIGKACFEGGPGVIFLFVFCAIACGLAALCYAEFAARIPLSGSAYTYAYASFGELMAWIIGWALIMEYAIGNIYVAFSWSGYFVNVLKSVSIHIPEWLTINYSAAKTAYLNKTALGSVWDIAPKVGSLRIILDLPAFLINIAITALVYFGVSGSKKISNFLVIFKILIIILVIVVGYYYINSTNYFPFVPNGFGGIMQSVSAVFFTYIGFDAISTLAEESKNPSKDLPWGMFYALGICTVLYICISLVLTGMVNFSLLNVSDPLAFVMQFHNVKWLEYFLSISAVIAMTSVLLVFQMGQPRIWYSMSRDGLLPPIFSKIHTKFKTPSFATLITGLVVGIPILFTNADFVLDFTSIGTIFAFVLVCGGVLLLEPRKPEPGKFYLPHVSSKVIFPLIVGIAIFCLIYFVPSYFMDFADAQKLFTIFGISHIVFWVIILILTYFSIVKNLSLIPLLGLTTCLYLLTGMALSNWIWFFVWFGIGLIVYFVYGYKKSKLA